RIPKTRYFPVIREFFDAERGSQETAPSTKNSFLRGPRRQAAQHSRRGGLERSSSPGNEPRDARIDHRIEPDSRTDPSSDLFDGIIGKSRDIKILLEVTDAGSGGERSRAALQRPCQQDLSGGFVDALRNDGDHRIVGQPRFNAMTQSREGLHHDAIALAIVEQIRLREIWMGFDLNDRGLNASAIEHLFQLRQIDVRQPDRVAPTLVHEALQSLPGILESRRVVVNHVAVLVSRILFLAGFESEWSMGA